jgi:hypothetical protein
VGVRLCDVRTIGLYTGYMRLRGTGSERTTCLVWVDKTLSKYSFGRFIRYESLLLTWALEHIFCEDGKWIELAQDRVQ